MGDEPLSIFVSRPILERLVPHLCFSSSMEVASADEFCSSKPENWPVGGEPDGMVKLAYPEEKGKSLPGIANFCSAYMNWHTETGCGLLAKDIAEYVGRRTTCGFVVEQSAANIVAKMPRQLRRTLGPDIQKELAQLAQQGDKSCNEASKNLDAITSRIQTRCKILFDNGEGNDDVQTLNSQRAEDLHRIATFCLDAQRRDVQKASAGISVWKILWGGGGAAGGVALAVLAVKYFFKGSKFVRRVGHAFDDISRGIDRMARASVKFFTVSVPNLIKAAGYVFSLGWARGKKPPVFRSYNDPSERRGRGEDGQMRPDGKDESLDEPRQNVVQAQFGTLGAEKSLQEEWERFQRLSTTARTFLTYQAIRRWYTTPEIQQEEYLRRDSRPLPGKLPIHYLRDFVRDYLKSDTLIPIIEEAASVWASQMIHVNESLIFEIKLKLSGNERFLAISPQGKDYLARLCEFRWRNMPSDARRVFVSGEPSAVTNLPSDDFVHYFLEGLGDIVVHDVLAYIFRQMVCADPRMASLPFEVIHARTTTYQGAWASLIEDAKGAFNEDDGLNNGGGEHMPFAFVRFMNEALKIGTAERQEAKPATEPWNFAKATEVYYKTVPLHNVMADIVGLDGRFAFYPDILSERARGLVDSWLAFPEMGRLAYGVRALEEDADSVSNVPKCFVEFWHGVTREFSASARGALLLPEQITTFAVRGKKGGDGSGGGDMPQGPAGNGADGGDYGLDAAVALDAGAIRHSPVLTEAMRQIVRERRSERGAARFADQRYQYISDREGSGRDGVGFGAAAGAAVFVSAATMAAQTALMGAIQPVNLIGMLL